jgi:hypothetical protein
VREAIPQSLFERLTEVEGGARGLAFASGVAAATAVMQSLAPGSHVLFPDDAYYGMYRIADEFFPVWGLSWSKVAMRDADRFRAALRPETKLVWLESPSNPLLQVTDLRLGIALAHGVGALAFVDTPSPPALQRPLGWALTSSRTRPEHRRPLTRTAAAWFASGCAGPPSASSTGVTCWRYRLAVQLLARARGHAPSPAASKAGKGAIAGAGDGAIRRRQALSRRD